MPGILGIVRPGGGAASGLSAALRALAHFDGYAAVPRPLGPSVALGQVWRDGDRSARDFAAAKGVAVAASGVVLDAARGRRIGAADLLERCLRRGAVDPAELDGSFVVVVADERRNRVAVINDHVGTLPVYYASGGSLAGTSERWVCFGPEIKALHAATGRRPALSAAGVLSLLNCGYCLGRTTLFDGVACLEPGSVLEIATDAGGIETRRHWKSVYRPHRSLARRAAAERALHDAVRRAHETIVADAAGGFELMLSGGWDSRGILAFLESIGRLPSAAFAWGARRDVPDSDPYIAERLAARTGVPLRFLAYDSDRLLDNAASWCRLSELANDNVGWFAEGASALAGDYRTAADFSIVGDECWGWHGHPRTEQDARVACLPARLGGALEACLRPARAAECADLYEAEVDAVLDACENEHPADRRDFLYLHGRVARFIFSLGYYKELAVEIRRPFLLKGVLDVVTQLPRRFRAEKNLYVSMLCRFFPEIARETRRRARSLPDWRQDMRRKPALRRFFVELIGESADCPVLDELIDPGALDRLASGFFDAPAGEGAGAARRATLRSLLPMRTKQRLRAAGLYPGSRRMTPGYPRRDAADVLRCVALIALLHRELARVEGAGERASAPSRAPEQPRAAEGSAPR